ncbi:MAG: HD domain-containing protein [Kiritimatiellae bacterium]|nr:HD domain-containing protein [Kiritimatiellia bacterium]
MREKTFKDPVHGYISVPADWCDDFLDTPVFQRLRFIEQTSMRVLYPAAHHDRFIHSLGTYHLGRRLFECLKKNSAKATQALLENYRNTFLLACLLHDCGHAPFSHTCEHFYNYNRGPVPDEEKPVYQKLKAAYSGSNDFEVGGSWMPKAHEAFSAIIMKQCFSAALEKYSCDVELAARMITGCTYPNVTDSDTSVKNCLIGLLNGAAIDVDKLDYIVRDTWASGVQNTMIDVDRLLAAARFHDDASGKQTLCYAKSALSVLQTVLNARNYLYEWIYGHHTVLYYSNLLNRAVCALAKKVSPPENPELFWKTIFSEKPFIVPQQIEIGSLKISIYLPNDGDLLCLLKQFRNEIGEVREYLDRKSTRFALWKTHAEFRTIFKAHPMLRDPLVVKSISDWLPGFLAEKYNVSREDIVLTDGTFNPSSFEKSEVLILINDTVTTLTDVLDAPSGGVSKKDSFYVFVPMRLFDKKNEMIQSIHTRKR